MWLFSSAVFSIERSLRIELNISRKNMSHTIWNRLFLYNTHTHTHTGHIIHTLIFLKCCFIIDNATSGDRIPILCRL